MGSKPQTKKYTLSLPTEIYHELDERATKHNTSIKDIVRQCLKFGLIAMKVEDDPNSDIIFRERVKTGVQNGDPVFETRDTYVKIIV